MSGRRIGILLVALFVALSFVAGAQERLERPVRLPAFGRSVVSSEDTTALVVNPANLGFIPGYELRWSSVYLAEESEVPWQGHALAFGFPLPFVPLATGIRLDFINPPGALERAPNPVRSDAFDSYQWLTWALALKAGDSAALGVSLQRSYSETEALHGISSWSFGFTSRPFDHLGMAFVAHDVNSPRTVVSNSRGLVGEGGRLDRSYDIGLAIRPFRSRVAELGLEGKYVDAGGGYWVPRAVLGIDIPPLGRLRGDFAIKDPTEQRGPREWIASAALAFWFSGPGGSFELGGGSVFGDQLGNDSRYEVQHNIQTDIAFRGWREPAGPEAPRYALRVRIESTPGTREHVSLLRRLWYVAEREDTIDAVVLELRTSPAESLARVEELRDAVHYLRRHGKRVLCHLEDADGSSLYLCAAANTVLINPAGGVRFAGLRTRYLYFKGLLDKLGIRAEVVRIGAHKSAPEQFTRDSASDTARADKIDLLQQHERKFVEGVSAGRRVPAEALRQRIARGPFIASEAKAAGLVDGYAFDDQLEEAASRMVGRSRPLLDDKRAPRARDHFGVVPGIALIYVDGDMVDGRSETIPFLGMKLVGSYTIAESLKQARENPQIGAIVLRIETGGGSAMAADVIWREVQITARYKPVVVSMGSFAASGGYYIAAPATRIFSNSLTITGSIGIFYGKADVAELLRKIGVSVEIYKTAPRADAESIFRPYTADERKELERKVSQFYDVFLSRVAEGRRLSKQQVDAVGQGRVWTGEQALSHRLVDELGGLRQALEDARRRANLPEHAPIVELPPPDTTLLGKILGIEGVSEQNGVRLPAELTAMVRALAPFAIHPGDRPLARIELVPLGP